MYDFQKRIFETLKSTGEEYQTELQELRKEADVFIAQPVQTVIDKTFTAHSPSDDPHDYVSVATYWWPNPETEDGLPYVSRDGLLSPDFELYDRGRWENTVTRTGALARAAYFMDDSDFADAAADTLRKWFIAPATRMNPNLQHAQFIPGQNTGRPCGIIDFALYLPNILFLLEQLRTLPDSSWSKDDQAALQNWCRELLIWLETHEFGKAEDEAHNNHGTYYDVIYVALALFSDQTAKAEKQLQKLKARIASQIEADGTMPHELKRTCSFGYYMINLRAFLSLALTAREIGVDVIPAGTSENQLLRTAVDWFYQIAGSDQEWPYEQIEPIDWRMLVPVFAFANEVFENEFPISKVQHRFPPDFRPESFPMLEPIHPFGQARG